MILRLERLEPGGLIVWPAPEVKAECGARVHKWGLPWGKRGLSATAFVSSLAGLAPLGIPRLLGFKVF